MFNKSKTSCKYHKMILTFHCKQETCQKQMWIVKDRNKYSNKQT